MNFLEILPNFAGDRLWLALILLAVGIFLIIKGGDWFVDAAVWMANVLHMPKFLIGATIVSLATTLPEMIVSIIATANANGIADPIAQIGFYATAAGNAIGSVTANTGLILALSAIFVSGTVDKKDFGFKALLIIITCLVLFGFAITPIHAEYGHFNLLPSFILFGVFAVYMVQTIISAKKGSNNTDEVKEEEEDEKESKHPVLKNIILFVIGTAGIVFGSDLLVTNATIVATKLGVSEGIIAVTLVAIGTSLPELITTISSIVKKQGELGVGNVIGANIIDLTLIMPICSFISGGNLVIVNQSRFLDIPACLVISGLAVIPTIITKKFHKWQGFAMLVLYITYIVLACVLFPQVA